MRALELIARLNPKSLNLAGSAGGKSNGSLKMEDIAAALAGLSDPFGSAMLRHLYAGEDGAALAKEWQIRVIKIAADKGWLNKSTKKPETVYHLANATLHEHLDGRCRNCLGRGTKRKLAKNGQQTAAISTDGAYLVIECEECQGTGKSPLKTATRARLCNVAFGSFQKTWALRYDDLLLELAKSQRIAEDEFMRGLK